MSERLCYRCERLPTKVAGAGSLYLWFPLGHTFGKAVQFFRQRGYEIEALADRQGLRVSLQDAEIQNLALKLVEILSRRELQDIQVLFMEGTAVPQLHDFPRTSSLQRLLTLSQSDWLLEMIGEGRITSYFQPIVQATDTTQVFAQEALLRGLEPDGRLVSPGMMLEVARDADLLFQLDLAARRSAIQAAHRHQVRSLIFINFTPSSIYDPQFCLRSTVEAIDEVGIPHDQIVFELTESDRSQEIEHLQAILRFYRAAGFRVALDDVGSGYSSLNLLHQLRPDFIKLDMELTRNVNQDPYKALIAAKVLDIAQQLHIQTVAEGIESPGELAWVREYGADFVQGYCIARPSAQPVTQTRAI
jgi:EAL domain-containing protein (putative c-di-GMP-specific phosphodiesterase class I)